MQGQAISCQEPSHQTLRFRMYVLHASNVLSILCLPHPLQWVVPCLHCVLDSHLPVLLQ